MNYRSNALLPKPVVSLIKKLSGLDPVCPSIMTWEDCKDPVCSMDFGEKWYAVISDDMMTDEDHKEDRRYMTENCLIETIIRLPENMFKDPDLKASVIIFSLGNYSVMCVDASDYCTSTDTGRSTFMHEDIDDIMSACKKESDISVRILNSEIAKNDFSFGDYLFSHTIKLREVVLGTRCGLQISPEDLESITSDVPTPFYCIKPSYITDNEISEKLYLKECPDSFRNHEIRNNDLIISKLGKPLRVAVAKAESSKSAIAIGRLYVFDIDTAKTDPWKLQKYLISKEGRDQLLKCDVGQDTRDLNLEKILDISIPRSLLKGAGYEIIIPETVRKLAVKTGGKIINVITAHDLDYCLSEADKLEGDDKLTCVMLNYNTYKVSYVSFRKKLIDKRLVDTVIQLPEHLLEESLIPVTMMIFSKNCEDIMMIDATDQFRPVNRLKNILSDENIKKIQNASVFESDISCIVSYEKVTEYDYILDPSVYLLEKTIPGEKILLEKCVKKAVCGLSVYNEKNCVISDVPTEYRILRSKNIKDDVLPKPEYLSEWKEGYDKHCVSGKCLLLKWSYQQIGIFAADLTGMNVLISGNIRAIETDEQKIDVYRLKDYLSGEEGQKIIRTLYNFTAFSLPLGKIMKIPLPAEIFR